MQEERKEVHLNEFWMKMRRKHFSLLGREKRSRYKMAIGKVSPFFLLYILAAFFSSPSSSPPPPAGGKYVRPR